MSDKELGHESETWVSTKIRVTESEKKLLEGLAQRYRPDRGPRKPSIGKAVVHLLRIAFQCLMHHHEPKPPKPKKLGSKTLGKLDEIHGMGVVAKRTLQKPSFYTITPDGKKTWDSDEDLPGNNTKV